jgi:hypothetical protein
MGICFSSISASGSRHDCRSIRWLPSCRLMEAIKHVETTIVHRRRAGTQAW